MHNTNDILPPASPTLHATICTFIAIFIAIIIGSIITKTEIVARGKGQIISSTRTQIIQPKFEGQILKILVRNGDSVKQGDTLLTLVPTQIENEIEKLNAELKKEQKNVVFSDFMIKKLTTEKPEGENFLKIDQSSLMNNSYDLDVTEIKNLASSILQTLQTQINEINAHSDQIIATQRAQEARIARAQEELNLATQQNKTFETLLKKGVISEAAYLNKAREMRGQTHQLNIENYQQKEQQATLKLNGLQRNKIITENLSNYREKTTEARNRIETLIASLKTAQMHLSNTVLTAPVSGKIENLSVYTIGGTVQQGQVLMSIVPDNSVLEVEAFFENRDAGFLKSGQKAIVKLDAFPAERFGFIKGQVTSIGADARKNDEKGEWVYAATISLERTSVLSEGRRFSFRSGMSGTVDVITGERRFISYFLEPIVKAIQDGFGER